MTVAGRGGRPLGYKPKSRRNLTHQMGPWQWDTNLLNPKIKPIPGQCHIWTGAQGPQGNLFGAVLEGSPRMTQANRLIYFEATGQDVTNYAVRMTCKNKFCCNPQHMELKTNIQMGRQEMENLGFVEPKPQPDPTKPRRGRPRTKPQVIREPREMKTRRKPESQVEYKLSIADYAHTQLPIKTRMQLKAMSQEFAHENHHDSSLEYRYMLLSAQNFLLAELKYPELTRLLTVSKQEGAAI